MIKVRCDSAFRHLALSYPLSFKWSSVPWNWDLNYEAGVLCVRILKTTCSAVKDIGRTAAGNGRRSTGLTLVRDRSTVDKQRELFPLSPRRGWVGYISVIAVIIISSGPWQRWWRFWSRSYKSGLRLLFVCRLLSPPLLSPIKGCLYLNNKALISVNYYSSGHCILCVSLFCFYSSLLSSFSTSYPHPDPSLSSVLALTSPCPFSLWKDRSVDVCLTWNLANWILFLPF